MKATADEHLFSWGSVAKPLFLRQFLETQSNLTTLSLNFLQCYTGRSDYHVYDSHNSSRLTTLKKVGLFDISDESTLSQASYLLRDNPGLVDISISYTPEFQFLLNSSDGHFATVRSQFTNAFGLVQLDELSLENVLLQDIPAELWQQETLMGITLRCCNATDSIPLVSQTLTLQKIHLMFGFEDLSIIRSILSNISPIPGLKTLVLLLQYQTRDRVERNVWFPLPWDLCFTTFCHFGEACNPP